METSASNHFWFLLAFVALSCYNMGSMWTLQLQHFAIYPTVGEATFKAFISANNRAAFWPAIFPFLVATLLRIVQFWFRPVTTSTWALLVILVLNVLFIVSTLVWQGRLRGQMAVSGFDATKIQTLITTNWLRTIILSVEAALALWLIYEYVQGQAGRTKIN